MITSAKNYTKNKKTDKKNGQSEPQDKWQKQSSTDKITKKHTHTHSQKEKKEKNIYIIKKGREQPNQ